MTIRAESAREAETARHDKMVELVTRMMEFKKQQARAPKKQSPSGKQLFDQKLAITDHQGGIRDSHLLRSDVKAHSANQIADC